MQPASSNKDSRPIFLYHVHNQAGFDNTFINGRGFMYLGISKMSFTFKYLQEFKVAYQKRQLETLIFDYTPIFVGSWKSNYLNLNVSGIKRHVALKQKYGRFPFGGDHIHVIPTFEHPWANLRHTVI